MAIRLTDEYPNRTGAVSSDYPDGSIINESTPGADDGTPLEQAWGNDVAGFMQALLESAGISRSGNPDTVPNSQHTDALLTLTRGLTEVDVGGSSNVTLSNIDSRIAMVRLTGTLAGDIDVIVPDTVRHYVFINQTSGDFNVIVKTETGTGVQVLKEDPHWLYSDGTDVQTLVYTKKQVENISSENLFIKSDKNKVVFSKTGNFSIELSQDLKVEVDGTAYEFSQGDSVTMPATPSAGTDLAVWVEPDGTLRASENFTATGDVASGSRQIGGFHYAPGGNASFGLNAGDGSTTPQINEYSFYDLKWRPSVIDPRGLTLVGDGAFWCGIYHLAADHLAGPPHRHGVDPARDGNPPNLIDGSGNYPDAQPMNIFESLWYHGFRTPRVEDFQLLAFGTNEETSRGSDPGTTGLPDGNTDAQFTSHWGVIQSTGVIQHWGNDSILSSNDQTLPNPPRGGRFRVVRFAALGGGWGSGSGSGSRRVDTRPATASNSNRGGRGVCDHLILD